MYIYIFGDPHEVSRQAALLLLQIRADMLPPVDAPLHCRVTGCSSCADSAACSTASLPFFSRLFCETIFSLCLGAWRLCHAGVVFLACAVFAVWCWYRISFSSFTSQALLHVRPDPFFDSLPCRGYIVHIFHITVCVSPPPFDALFALHVVWNCPRYVLCPIVPQTCQYTPCIASFMSEYPASFAVSSIQSTNMKVYK